MKLAVTIGLLLSGATTAQVSADDRELLLGKEHDLAEFIEDSTSQKIESLTQQTPAWMRILIRRTWEKESTKGLLQQLPKLLRDGDLIDGIGEVMVRRATDKIIALEGEWTTKDAEELDLPDLASLAAVYGLLKSTQEYVNILTASTPWEPMLAMFLSREYRLTKEQYAELFDYLKKLPARARALHARAAAILLRRSDDPKLTSGILRQLSFTYRSLGNPRAAVLLMREALRRKEKVEAHDWILLAQDYARSLDTKRARRALSIARAVIATDDVKDEGRKTAEKRIAAVDAIVKLADEVSAIDRGPADGRSVADKIKILDLLRRLRRPVEAGKLAQQLDQVPVRDSRVYSNLGLLCMRGGLREKAVKCMQIAEKLPNPDGTLHQLRAWLLLRPLLGEGVLLLRGQGDIGRTLDRAVALRDEVAILVTKHGVDDLAIFKLALELLAEFRPAIEKKDLRLGLEILKKNKSRMLELRETNYDILGLQQLALCAIGAIQDTATMRRVLSGPTAAEKEDPSLVKLRCVLAFLLRQHVNDPATRKLVRSTFGALPADAGQRHVYLGVEAAMTADQSRDARLWDVAIRHFRAGLKIEKLTPKEKARLLNCLGMCFYFQGQTKEALPLFAAAIAADTHGSNAARLNAITCQTKPDAEKLAALAALATKKNWHSLSDEVARWQIVAARSAGDAETARALAKRILENRSVAFPVGHPMVMRDGSFTWSVGTSTKGADFRATFEVTPWLTRPSPLTGDEIDALAK